MKFLYIIAAITVFLKILFIPDLPEPEEISIVERVVNDSGVSNAVSGIIFRNRLYDTIFEVVVFTIAILGVGFLFGEEQSPEKVHKLRDRPSIVLARVGATITALVALELAIRGHLSPGGGFAAGVAGGTAIGLIAVTSSSQWMERVYKKWNAAVFEKLSVLVFIFLAAITLMGWELPHGELGALLSGGALPLFNILVAIKVALGSWAVILLFIRYRGLF